MCILLSNPKVAAAISRFNAKRRKAPEVPCVDVPVGFAASKGKLTKDLESFAEKEIVDDNGELSMKLKYRNRSCKRPCES